MNIEAYLREEAKADRAWGAYSDACQDLATAGSNDEHIQFEAIVAYQYARWQAVQARICRTYSAERTARRQSQIRAA